MGIETDRPPRDMNLAELQSRCWSEIEKFNRKEQNNDQYCLEIFRRALVRRDEHAWNILTQRFSGTITAWLRRHPNREAACRLHSEENYVALTMEKLWLGTVRNTSLEFDSLAAALKFMRCTLNSVVIDALRGQAREAAIPEAGFDEPAAPDYDSGEEFWEIIKSLIPDAREQRLAYLLYHCGLKPRQIVQFCPQEFSNVQEIFRMTRNILDRLRRKKDRLRWLLDGEDL